LDIQLLGGLPFILDVITLPSRAIVRRSVANESEKAGRQVQQHAGETVTRLRGIQIGSISPAGRELIKSHGSSIAIVEAMDVIEHEPSTERVGAANFLEVGIDLVGSDGTEGNCKLARSAKAGTQADLGHDRNPVSHGFERSRVRGVQQSCAARDVGGTENRIVVTIMQ